MQPNTPSHASGTPGSRIVLRAVAGRPLADEQVRSRVLAIAREVCEHAGVRLLSAFASERDLEVVIEGDSVAALALGAALRHESNEWYEAQFESGPLWPARMAHDDDGAGA